MPDSSVRVLKNAEMAANDLLPMPEAVRVVEDAFRELGEGRAKNVPRSRIHVPEGGPPGNDDVWYWFNNIVGAVPGCDTLALRIDSAFREIVDVHSDARGDLGGDGERPERAGSQRTKMTYPGDFVGLVLVFDIHTGGLRGILDDHYLSPIRVGATSAVGTDRLARPEAASVGALGAGEQARAQLEAVATVRPIEEARVFSPTPESREAFATEMSASLDFGVRAVDDPAAAVRGADIVNLATNANEPVIDGRWIDPGTHVNSIVGGDSFRVRQELDDETVRRADRIVVNLFEQVVVDRQGDLYPRFERGVVDEDDIDELADLVVGAVSGRRDADEITLLKNNTGMGIQFAATAAAILDRAERRGLGRTLPHDLFATRNEAGYSP